MNNVTEFSMPREAVADETGMNIAFIRLNMDLNKESLVNVGWLPEFFSMRPLAPELRDEIVRVMRLHADVLESGALEKRMEEIRKIKESEGKPCSNL